MNKQLTNLDYDEEGRVIIQSRKNNMPEKDENGRYIIKSRKKIHHNNYNGSLDKKIADNICKLIAMDSEDETVVSPNDSINISVEDITFQQVIRNIGKMKFHPLDKIDKKISGKFETIKKKNFLLSDIENTDVFVTLYGKWIRHDVDASKWLWWTGKQWKIDDEFMVYNFAAKTMHELSRYIQKHSEDETQKRKCISCQNHTVIRHILEVAKTRCVCHTKDFDVHKHLLNVRNGIIDLRTRTLYEHKPKYMITKFIDVDYDPDAYGDRFDDFIKEICDYDEDLAKYEQILYGYGITGETGEQSCYIESGSGANGKSTLNNIIENTVSDYTDTVSAALFRKTVNTSANAPSPEIAKLAGKRMVFIRETDGFELNEAKVKEITGSTRITARALYLNPFTYIPQFTMFLETNNKPTIKGADHGIWRRIVVIPFKCTFKKDITLERVLLQEKEAILKWLVDGAYYYYNEGFPKCKEVRKATEAYHEEEDTVGAFIKCALQNKKGSECPAKVLHSAYQKFCENSCNVPLNIKEFKNAMSIKGYKNKRKNSGMVWLNVAMKD